MQLELKAPSSFWRASREEGDSVVGGCGPGYWGDFLVPDRIWWLSIERACRIHDWMYALGETREDKIEADLYFLFNMLELIRAGTRSRILRYLRDRTAFTYYQAVSYGGDEFFNLSEEQST